MTPHVLRAVPLLAVSLMAQPLRDAERVFRMEANGVELSLQSNAKAVETTAAGVDFFLGGKLRVRLTRQTDDEGVRLRATIQNQSSTPVSMQRAAERSGIVIFEA